MVRIYVILLSLLAATTQSVPAQPHTSFSDAAKLPSPSAEVLILGTFHFADAGHDSYRPKFEIDVRSVERQNQVRALVEQLANFRPTKVAVEVLSERQDRLDSLYGAYLAGNYELGSNEIFQLGFRLAKHLGHERVWAVDAPGRRYDAEMTQEEYEAEVRQRPGVDTTWGARYRALYAYEDSLKTTMSLAEYYRRINTPEHIIQTLGHYLVGGFTRSHGPGDYFGVDQMTWWWNRNLRIFRNLQRITHAADERILLIIGSGHVPIIRHAVEASPEYELVELAEYLEASHDRQESRSSRTNLQNGTYEKIINGVRLWYRVAGAGSENQPPVVFLHGGPGANSQRFASLIGPRLERNLKMVYLDQRGSGRSERPWTGEYSLDILLEDIDKLRQELGAEQIALIGHSFGTMLALEYAAKYPRHVSRLVVAAAVPDVKASGRSMCARLAATNPEAHARAVSAAAEKGNEDCDIFAALPQQEREAFFRANMFPDASVRAQVDSVDAAHGLRNTGELSRSVFASGLLEYRFTEADRLTMPVLIIAGGHDYQVGLEGPRQLQRMLPAGRLEIYDESGHFMYVDEPERFARDVTTFLSTPFE